MRKVTIILLLVFFAFGLHAQTKVDSLVNVLETQTLTSEEKTNLYSKIGQAYINSYQPELSIKYLKEGITFVQKEKNKEATISFYEAIGLSYNMCGIKDTALIYYEKALDLAIDIKNEKLIASVQIDLGSYYDDLGDFEKAMEYYMKSLSYFESVDDKSFCLIIYANIGSLFRMMEMYDRALFYFEKAQLLAEELNHITGKLKVYHELGTINFFLKENIDKAVEYELKVRDISIEIGAKRFQYGSTEVLAAIYLAILKDYVNAEKYAQECLQLAIEFNDPNILHGAYRLLANLYFAQEKYEESKNMALNAWRIDSVSLHKVTDLAETLTNVEIFLGNKEEANYYFNQYIDLKNRFIDDKIQETMTNLEMKYETEKKELRIAVLEKEKTYFLWLSFAGAAILLLILGLLLARHQMNKQKRKIAEQKVQQLEHEKQLIATQAVLDGETAERSRLARDLHDGLGGMLSVVKLNLKEMKVPTVIEESDMDRFSKALEMLDQSIGELRRVAHHMMPESLLRYGLRVSLEDFCRAIPGTHFQYFGENPRMDNRLEILIYRCAYELINNAVKHANAQNINVQLIVDNGLISLTVQDDGVGFNPETIDSSGTGLNNIRTRIAIYYGKMTINSLPNNGTEICIEIEQI